MLRVLNCLAYEHNLGLVLLAGAICVLSSLATMRVYASLRQTAGSVRRSLFAIGALIAGSGIWTTHFVAMLAYEPGLATGYEPVVTVVSLVLAVGFSAAALHLLMQAQVWVERALAGVVFGGGIGAMHYVGMTAFETEGYLSWDINLVGASVVFGMLLSAGAFALTGGRMSLARQAGAALVLTLAICAMHFTGMGAASIVPSADAVVEPQSMSNSALSFGVAAIAILIIIGGTAATLLESAARGAAHARMRRLANAAQEGLVVLRGDIIEDANAAFLRFTGASLSQVVGRPLDQLLRRDGVVGGNDIHSEGVLMTLDGGEGVPVEVLRRHLEVAGGDTALTVLAIRDLSERRSAEARIRYLAEHDSLTDLPNRHALNLKLEAALERAAGTGEAVALLCIDLDNFKEANDLHGHQAGDALLVATARRVSAALTAPSFAARLGGDEFVVVQIGAKDAAAEASALAAELVETLRRPVSFEGHDVLTGCSIGIALFGEDGGDAQTLMANADMALYRAKDAGRGNFRFFKREMDESIRDRRALARELRQAIADRLLTVFYQPQVSSDGTLCGFEALLRWTHPLRGAISPAEFIPLAEENGLIGQLGEWVLREACAEAASWDKELGIAVNLSPLQLHQRNLVAMVREVLFETGLRAGRLELEVTETALFKDYQRALDTLRGLKAMGVRIAMDDFGTGFSSLSTLQSFPFDKIKIDKSFVENINRHERANVIVRAVLGIGRSLEIPVVAEGVETQEQIAFLREERCAEMQGYAFGRPAPVEQIRAMTSAGPLRAAS